MGWRDTLIPASLNGVDFLYRKVSNTFGRRQKVHEFAGGEIPFVDDMGKKADRYHIEAFIIGEDYGFGRDALREVLTLPHADLEFAHPYSGYFTVRVDGDCVLSESDEEGGMAKFSIKLVESGLAFPQVLIPTVPQITLLVESLSTALPEMPVNLLGALADVFESVIAGTYKGVAAIGKANALISSALNLIDRTSQAIDALNSEIGTLIATPRAIFNEIVQLINSIMALVKTAQDLLPRFDVTVPEPDLGAIVLEALNILFAFVADNTSVYAASPQGQLEAAANAVTTSIIKAAGLAAATEQLSQIEIESSEEAYATMDSLVAMYNELLSDPTITPEVLEILGALKATAIDHFATIAATLPTVRIIQVQWEIPAMVLAYRLYDDAELGASLAARNNLPSPAFVPPRTDIRVLAND